MSGPQGAREPDDRDDAARVDELWGQITGQLKAQGMDPDVLEHRARAQERAEAPDPASVPPENPLGSFLAALDREPQSILDDPEGYTPPPAPPLPRPRTRLRRWAWSGAFGGPVVMITQALLGVGPRWVSAVALAAAIAGFVTLVALAPDRRPDGWDDGAVI